MHFLRLFRLAPVGILILTTACSDAEQPQHTVRPVLVTHPERVASMFTTYPGDIRARFEPQLAFQIGGKVSKRLVNVGDRVRESQPLAELDPLDIRLDMEASHAKLEAAKAYSRMMSAERTRYQTLLTRQLASQSKVDDIENRYRAGEARLRQLQAQYQVVSNRVGYTVLRAPQDGLIVNRSLEVGQVVSAGQTVFTLAGDGPRDVVINIPEHVVDQFTVGKKVAVELWADHGTRHSGTLREVSPAADAISRTYQARVTLKVPVGLGQSARVYVHEKTSQLLSVPLSALSAVDGKPYVWVVQPGDNTVTRKTVKSSAFDEDSASVEGLNLGDWVVVAGGQLLLEGQVVRPSDPNNRLVSKE